MPLTGVAGWPVGHSRSVVLHRAAFAALGLPDWGSQLLPIPPELFRETVLALPASGFTGINVTIPHKEAALAVSDEASDDAQGVGAANTLTFVGDRLVAANTDSPAISAAVRAMIDPGEIGSALVIGAGGSARAALHALRGMDVERISVLSRSAERAQRVAGEFGGDVVRSAIGADLILNCSPVGLDPTQQDQLGRLGLSVTDLASSRLVVDLVYSSQMTELVSAARSAGCASIDGLEILARQGALSVGIWTGQTPHWRDLDAAVRAVG